MLIAAHIAHGQSSLPEGLEGTWKFDGPEAEACDILPGDAQAYMNITPEAIHLASFKMDGVHAAPSTIEAEFSESKISGKVISSYIVVMTGREISLTYRLEAGKLILIREGKEYSYIPDPEFE